MGDEAKTLADQKMEVANHILHLIKTPSVFTAWDPEQMQFSADRKTHLLPAPELERYKNAGRYQPADMWVLKALHCLTYAPTECVWALLRYWYKKEMQASAEERRTRLCVPNFQYYSDIWTHLTNLAANGVVARFNFFPMVPKPTREGKPETVFKVGGHAVALYKKILNERGMPYNPIEAYYNPEDVFACCLNAYAITPFLSSKCLRDVKFKESEVIDGRDHKMSCLMTFFTNDEGGHEHTTDLIFEGITFKTNENVVSKNSRHLSNAERIEELAHIYESHSKKAPTYLVLCLEDALGIQSASVLIKQCAPEILDKCFFTTGNVLFASNALYHPENLRKCFITYERDAASNDVKLNGAAGYYFLDIEPEEISLDTST